MVAVTKKIYCRGPEGGVDRGGGGISSKIYSRGTKPK